MDDAVQADQIEEVVMPVLRDHGLELVDIEWRPLRPRGVLRLFVDKPGGVGIGDCERLSRGDRGRARRGRDRRRVPTISKCPPPGWIASSTRSAKFRWAVGKRVRLLARRRA